jgi:hypothetical protein
MLLMNILHSEQTLSSPDEPEETLKSCLNTLCASPRDQEISAGHGVEDTKAMN